MAKGSISRIADIIRSNVSEVLDQLEDPEKLVRQAIRDMEGDVERATGSVGAAVANQRRLERQCERAQQRAKEWAKKAEEAVAAGNEEEARQALQRKALYEQTAEQLVGPLEESRVTAEQLRTQLHEMRAQLQEARNRQGNLIARYQAGRAGVEVQPEPSGVGGNAFADFRHLEQRISEHEGEFERMRQKVDTAEAVAEAQRELAEEFGQVKSKLVEEEVNERVERELAQLQAEKKGK